MAMTTASGNEDPVSAASPFGADGAGVTVAGGGAGGVNGGSVPPDGGAGGGAV